MRSHWERSSLVPQLQKPGRAKVPRLVPGCHCGKLSRFTLRSAANTRGSARTVSSPDLLSERFTFCRLESTVTGVSPGFSAWPGESARFAQCTPLRAGMPVCAQRVFQHTGGQYAVRQFPGSGEPRRALPGGKERGLDRDETISGHGSVPEPTEELAPAGRSGLSLARQRGARPFRVRSSHQSGPPWPTDASPEKLGSGSWKGEDSPVPACAAAMA